MTKDLIEKLLALGLSQGEISRRASIAQPSIHRILRGRQTDVSYSSGKRLEQLIAELEAHPKPHSINYSNGAENERTAA